MEYGYEGLGLFYSILEKLAQQEKPVKTEVLKKQLFVGKKLEKCWNFMESIDIISSNNGETFNKQLLNFSEKFMIKKEKNRKRISEWRENQDNIKNVTCNETVRNTDKDNISKVKVNKVNKDIYDFSFVELDYKKPFDEWMQYKKERKENYKSQSSIVKFYNQLKLYSNFNPETAQKIVDNSMSNNWAGIFKPKTENNGSATVKRINSELNPNAYWDNVENTRKIS